VKLTRLKRSWFRRPRPKRIIAQAVVVVMALGGVLVGTALPAHAEYRSINITHADLQNIARAWTLLGIAGEDPNYGAASEYGQPTGYAEWNIQDHSPNGHTIQEYYSPGRCLDSNFAGAAYGIPCNGGGYQRWDFFYEGQATDPFYHLTWDTYEIIDRATQRCLDANGSAAYTLPCNGGDYQRWFINQISGNGG
jgi:hypothetical protein